MDWQGCYTIGIVALLGAMMRAVAGPDLVMPAALFALAAAGVLTPAETFAGFANEALWAVGVLSIVSAGLRETGALEPMVARIFGRTQPGPAPGRSSGVTGLAGTGSWVAPGAGR